MKKYEAYKNSGIEWIGQIPEGWSVVPLKYNLSLKGRIGWNGLKSEEFQEKSYAYLVTGQDFNSDVVNWEKCYQINKERYDEDPFIQLENGDLLVTKDGTIGKVAKVVNLDKPACLNSGIFVVKQTKGVFEQNYLYWVLVSNQLKEFVGFNSTGSTIAHLYQNVFENMPLTVPPLTEQKAIASYLDYKVGQIDASISAINTQIDDLKSYRQSIISEAVTKGLNPNVPMKDSGVEWIGEIPSSWKVEPIKYRVDFFNGDISHHSVAVYIKGVKIFIGDIFVIHKRIRHISDFFVIGFCLIKIIRVVLRCKVNNKVIVVDNCLGLSFFVPEITYCRIEKYTQTYEKYCHKNNSRGTTVFFLLSSFLFFHI